LAARLQGRSLVLPSLLAPCSGALSGLAALCTSHGEGDGPRGETFYVKGYRAASGRLWRRVGWSHPHSCSTVPPAARALPWTRQDQRPWTRIWCLRRPGRGKQNCIAKPARPALDPPLTRARQAVACGAAPAARPDEWARASVE